MRGDYPRRAGDRNPGWNVLQAADNMLADEPTGALDLAMARNVLSILQQLNRGQDLTVLLITHNPAIAAIAGRTVRLVSGRVAETRVNGEPIAAEEVCW